LLVYSVPTPDPSFVLVESAIVGPELVPHTTPFAVIILPPSEVIVPPDCPDVLV